MVEYDVDLKTLEDMCSELSEACVLVNNELKILWSNSAYDALSPDPKRLLSEIFIDISPLLQVFQNGRLANVQSRNGIKVTCIPVRYEDKIASVLCIIDKATYTPILHHFLESMTRPAILFDHDMIYVGHNSLLDKEFKQAPAILDVALERLRSYDDKVKVLKSLLGITHDVKLMPLISGKKSGKRTGHKKDGYVILLYRKRSHK